MSDEQNLVVRMWWFIIKGGTVQGNQVCNQLGTTCTIHGTDHQYRNGSCTCHPHVKGKYCNACEPGYYGLWTGTGCLPCWQHCNWKNTLMENGLLRCDTLGRCKCKTGYDGARCEEKIPSTQIFCEECKPNCYKHENECKKCGACYNLVQDQLNEYLNLRSRISVEESHQNRLRNLEIRIKDLSSKIKDSPNVELENDINGYYQELDLRKRELKALKHYTISNELDKTLDLFDENFAKMNKAHDNFREELQNNENMELAKRVNKIFNMRDKAKKHADDVNKIDIQMTKTCTETCKNYHELNDSLTNNANAIIELQQKLLELDSIKNSTTDLLGRFNELCNSLNDLEIPEYDNKPVEKDITDLEEKLRLYQKVDTLLNESKDTKMDNILKTKKDLEKTIQDFDKYMQKKENTLTDLTSKLDRFKQITPTLNDIEKRLERSKTIIKNYLESNKELIKSLEISLALADTDDELTNIERELEFLTLEFEYIYDVAKNLQNKLNHARTQLNEQFGLYQTDIRILEKQWKEDEKEHNDLIDIYDFILKEIANKESLDAIEEEINEAYELLKITNEKISLDINVQYINNIKSELESLVVSAQEICGAKTEDSEQ